VTSKITLHLKPVTPMITGGYKGGVYYEVDKENYILEPPRPTDIAGKTRWYLRAIISGAVYEAFGFYPTIRDADKIAGEIMGDTRHRSKIAFKIEIKLNQNNLNKFLKFLRPYKQKITEHGKKGNAWQRKNNYRYNYLNNSMLEELEKLLREHSRLKLLYIKKDKKDKNNNKKGPLPTYTIVVPPELYDEILLTIMLSPGTSEEEAELLGYAIGLALMDMGFGRMTSRGFGKVDIIDAEEDYDNSYSLSCRFLEALNTVARYFQGQNIHIGKIINDSIKLAINIIGKKTRSQQLFLQYCNNRTNTPLFHTLHHETIHSVRLQPRDNRKKIVDILLDTAKLYVKEKKGYIAKHFPSYVFGGPRLYPKERDDQHVKYCYNLYTENRFQSPLHISIHIDSTGNNYIVSLIHYRLYINPHQEQEIPPREDLDYISLLLFEKVTRQLIARDGYIMLDFVEDTNLS